MGMTEFGFIPESYETINERIKGKLDAINPGFDFSEESPDGQMISIMSVELAEAWRQMDLIYMSYNPNLATGEALRNLGFITGIPYKRDQVSLATITTAGTTGTVIPQYTAVSDDQGNKFFTMIEAVVPAFVDVISDVAGNIPIVAGTITTIVGAVDGWTGLTQPEDGIPGGPAFSDSYYRNLRTRTVMRQARGQEEGIAAQLRELGIPSVLVVNNDTNTIDPIDGTPALTIQVKVGESPGVSDEEIALTILRTKPLGCPTFGTTTIATDDSQGTSHLISFTRAVETFIFIDLTVTLLDSDIGGVTDRIKYELSTHINSLGAGEDVIWSRLFEYITPYGKAQVDDLQIGLSAITLAPANVPITDEQYASNLQVDISITVA